MIIKTIITNKDLYILIPYSGIKITEIIMLVCRHKKLKKKVRRFYILKNEITLFEKQIPPPSLEIFIFYIFIYLSLIYGLVIEILEIIVI